MANVKVAEIGDQALLHRIDPIRVNQIKNKAVQKVIETLISTLKKTDGSGIAAPHIGENKRIVVLHRKPNKKSLRKIAVPLSAYVNPVIVEKSEERELDWEACLSIYNLDLLALVPRYKSIKMIGFDRQGKKVEVRAAGFKARLIQHELDHLEGKLFFERIRKVDAKYICTRAHFEKNYRKKWHKPQLIP